MIVAVNPSNIRDAAYVHSVSWQESHRSFCPAAFVAAHTPERQEKYLQQKIADGSKVFMLIEQAPVGIVSVKENIIEDLYVLPAFQRQGNGSALLQFAIAACNGTPTLWILENNHRARNFYCKAGFQETGKRKSAPGKLDEVEFFLMGSCPYATCVRKPLWIASNHEKGFGRM